MSRRKATSGSLAEFRSYINANIEYHPEFGLLEWRVTSWGRKMGEPCLPEYSLSKKLFVWGHPVSAIDVIWFIMESRLPEFVYDHHPKHWEDFAWEKLQKLEGKKTRYRYYWLEDDTAPEKPHPEEVRRMNNRLARKMYFGTRACKTGGHHSTMMIDGKLIYFEVHDSVEEAARLHDLVSLAFAPRQRLNFKKDEYPEEQIAEVKAKYSEMVDRVVNEESSYHQKRPITLVKIPPSRLPPE